MPTDRFPADPAGARAARRFARHALWDLGPVGEVAELLVSELATNVVRHASTAPFTVDVMVGDPIRVVVSDDAAVDLRAIASSDDAEAERGLMILESLAHRWGVEPTASGKQVWFELHPDELSWKD